MKKSILRTVALLLTTAGPIAFAQHGGHAGGGRVGDMGHDSSMHDSSMEEMLKMVRLQASDEQRAPYANYAEAAARIRQHTQAMVASGGGSEATLEQLGHQHEELKAAVVDFDKTHEAFVHCLRPEQQTEFKRQLGKIDRLRGDLYSRIQNIDHELSNSRPNSRRVVDGTKKVEKILNDWDQQRHAVGFAMGLEN